MAIKRQVQGRHRAARRAVAAGAVGAATLGALLLSTPNATAAPVTIPGLPAIDVPDNVLAQIPPNIGSQLPPGLLPPGTWIPGVTPPPAPPKSIGQRAVDAAMTRLGDPYEYGATGPNSFDCSGLVQWSYRQAGRQLPRTSYEQMSAGAPVSLNALQPGDVVSFYGGSHSALYVGNGNIIHASTYGEPVRIAPMSSMPVSGARRY